VGNISFWKEGTLLHTTEGKPGAVQEDKAPPLGRHVSRCLLNKEEGPFILVKEKNRIH